MVARLYNVHFFSIEEKSQEKSHCKFFDSEEKYFSQINFSF